jgi:hypothetical protein
MTTIAATSRAEDRIKPRVARLARLSTATIVTQLVAAGAIAALAVGRADHGELSPLALTGLVAGAAATSTLIAWPAGLTSGALEVLAGAAPPDCDERGPGALEPDVFLARNLWRRAVGLALLVGAWAIASAGLMGIALDNRSARAAVVVASLLGIGAVSTILVDAAARHRGAHAVILQRASTAATVSVRRRAWRDVALPIGAAQLLANIGAAWLLFHDDVRDPFADAPVVVTILAIVFAVGIAAPWGAVDVRLGRSVLDDPTTQRTSAGSPFGPQAIVYLALVGLLLAKGFAYLLPSSPSLWQVMLARGAFAGLLVCGYAALGYVRGALNALALEAADA